MFGSDPLGPYALYLVGPGYGFILGVFRMLFGESFAPGMAFSIIMGSLAPVAVYLIAHGVFRNRRMALMAGVIAAISHTSLALSGRILTDQTFFTLHAFTLACLIEGLRSGRWKYFVGAGLLCGTGALIRPAGQVWPYIILLLPLALPLPRAFVSRRRLLGRTAVTAMIALAMTMTWSARNYYVGGVFTFGSVGVLTARNCVVAQIESRETGRKIWDLRKVYEEEDGDHSLPFAESYENMQNRVKMTLAARPGLFVSLYFRNLWENAIVSNYFLRVDFPALNELGFDRIWEWLLDINRALVVVMFISMIVLALDRQWSALIVLGFVLGCFTLVTGFSYWQGSRLHYPAEMAWAVMIAYLLARIGALRSRRPLEAHGNRW